MLKLKHTFLNFNILGFGSTLRKRQKQMRKLWKPSWKWSVNIWHPHLVQPMLKGCSLMGGWSQLIIDLPYQEKSWTKFSFCEKMRWWRTSILAGYKKHSFVFQCNTKTIHMWWTKYDIYSSFLLLSTEGGRWMCLCACVFHPSPCYQIRKFFFYDIFHMNWFQECKNFLPENLDLWIVLYVSGDNHFRFPASIHW